MKKLFFLFAFVLLIAACSEEEDNEPKPNEPAAEEPTTPTTLEEAVVLQVPLNEGKANDEGPSSISGEIHGAVPAEDRDGNSNSALYFDGVDDYVDLGTTIDTDDISTISLWAKFDTLSTDIDMELISKSSYRQGMEVLVYRGNLSFYLVGVEDNNNIGVPVTSLDTAKWYHIAAIYDREAAQMKLYINGELKASDRAPASITKIDRLLLGNWNYAEMPRFFQGYLDDVRLYNRPLTEEEIAEIYNPAE